MPALRLIVFAELYATPFTRLPGKLGLSLDRALWWLDSVAERLELISLEPTEYRHEQYVVVCA